MEFLLIIFIFVNTIFSAFFIAQKKAKICPVTKGKMRIISHIEVDKCRLKDRMCSGNNKYDAFIKDSLQSLDSQEDDLDLLSRLAESGEDLAIIIDQKDADAVRVLTDFADPELDKEGHWMRTCHHMAEKYDDGGYLKLWIPESRNAEGLAALRDIIHDKSRLRAMFEAAFKECIKE